MLDIMKIVALDGHTLNPGDTSWKAVEALGEFTVFPRTPPEMSFERLADADIAITNKARLSSDLIERLPNLRFIAVTATGYDVVDVAAARKRGIVVSNVPGYSTDAVAQHTFALLLELTNRVGDHHQAIQAGEWTRCPDFSFSKGRLTELAGKTIGIVGFGQIGQRVAQIALAFNMRVLAHSRSRRHAIFHPAFGWADASEIFRLADVVSLHLPQTDETAGLVNASLLRTMKPTAFLINTARGGLVVEEDLAAALREERLAGAAVDVVSKEPVSAANPLLDCPNCIITPHLAWATLEARNRLMQRTAENIAAFQQGRPINVVG